MSIVKNWILRSKERIKKQMNKPELPVVYYQVKKIREFWAKSKCVDREYVLVIFDQSLKDIENTYLIELESWEEKQEELSA